jgi:hypothetical protein
MPSVFLLLFTLSAYACYRGFVEHQPRWQLIGAVCFCLAVLTYEFAVLLPGALALYLGLGLLRGDRGWFRGRPTMLALGLFAFGLALFGGLAMALRLGTLAGPLGEARGYFMPDLGLSGATFYLQMLLSRYWVLVAVGLLGLPLVARTQPAGVCYLGILLALTFLVPSFVLQNKLDVKYGLAMLPLVGVLAAAGTVALTEVAGRRLGVRDGPRTALPGLALLAVLALGLSGNPLIPVPKFREPPGPTWLQALRQEGLRSTDLVLSEGPERALFYLGRVDYHVYAGLEFRQASEAGYARYSYQAPDAVRSIYTNSGLLARGGDFERLVEQPNRGRTLWVIGGEDRLQRQMELMDPDLWPSLVRSARRKLETKDGWIMLKVTLPLSNRQG